MSVTTRNDIQRWLTEAKRRGARYLIVGLDTFDYGNYPIYVMQDADFYEAYDAVGSNGGGGMGDRVEEVYDMEMDIEAQLRESRSFHLPTRPDNRPIIKSTWGDK